MHTAQSGSGCGKRLLSRKDIHRSVWHQPLAAPVYRDLEQQQNGAQAVSGHLKDFKAGRKVKEKDSKKEIQ